MSGARFEAHLSNAFSTITFGNIIFIKRSEGLQKPTEQSMRRTCKEKVSLAPLYYPGTLANPDTCLGILYILQKKKSFKGIKVIVGSKTKLEHETKWQLLA